MTGSQRIPRHYAAASLKPEQPAEHTAAGLEYSAALRRGLIEAREEDHEKYVRALYSAALRRGLIEAARGMPIRRCLSWYSAALRRGLIEARRR